MRRNYVATLPSTFLQDEQPPPVEQQAESISERFFDEVRQLLEQKISSEAAAAEAAAAAAAAAAVANDFETTTTTESPPPVYAEERYIDTTITVPVERIQPKENLPTVKPPKPTQVSHLLTTFCTFLANTQMIRINMRAYI